MTPPFCTLCGNTSPGDLGTVIGICLDEAACHQRQCRNARDAGAREERDRLLGVLHVYREAERIGLEYPVEYVTWANILSALRSPVLADHAPVTEAGGLHPPIFFTTDGDTLWLKCFADDPDAEDGALIGMAEAGTNWWDLAAVADAHIIEHGC